MRGFSIVSSLLFAIVFALTGCTTMSGVSAQGSQAGPGQESAGPATSAQSLSVAPVTPVFYDFPDVPVPPELQMVRDASSVFQTSSVKTGVLVFRGRVDYLSVSDFFMSAMPREQWKLKGSSRYERSIMVFEKANRICVINVYPKMWYTYVEIYVLPGQP
ncbi:hypothetical protein [Thermodesulforhabdus norvegica]|uniref:Lipoprotein n=1 Tax=Thermodesulforhabdus norvegica TaxID=39841 RepID=A0A1I4VFY5_9BACT|nr:hypothetical protein [Thermodesulforhabdus norvegica]SFN00089.1 hypothetical protein SAMN05660836_02285 [Thermodesulforhabdus norvegica]